MVQIEITRKGVYGQDGGEIPVGTKLEFEREPTGWKNKYRVVGDTDGKTLEVATPEPETESEDNAELRDEYERVLGKRPGPRMKAETMQKHIDEAQEDGSNAE